jgi:thioester reductase-like protein
VDFNPKVLLENVNVIFHVAATVLFFECIADSLKMNVRGTYELLELARGMKKLNVS